MSGQGENKTYRNSKIFAIVPFNKIGKDDMIMLYMYIYGMI
jgi:hypothetical protein